LRALGVRDERPYAGLRQGDALLRAIQLGDTGKAQELLAAEADVNYRNTLTGITPLASAAYHGRRDLLEILVRAGSRIDDVPWGLREERIAVSSVPMAQRDLMRVAARGDTALISAVRRGDLAMAGFLLDSGAGLMVPNREGETPGLAAARAGDGAMMALLLERGLDPDVQVFPARISYLLTRYAQDEVLPPMLVEAARLGREEALAVLLRAGAAVDARDGSGRTALHWAAAAGHEGIVRLLLAQLARTDLTDRAGDSALALARASGGDGVARLLAAD
jgi:ankyrin repeat protein